MNYITCKQCGAQMPDDAYARTYGRCAKHADEELKELREGYGGALIAQSRAVEAMEKAEIQLRQAKLGVISEKCPDCGSAAWVDPTDVTMAVCDNYPTCERSVMGHGWKRLTVRQWAVVAFPKRAGDEYQLLSGRYDTKAGAETAADCAAHIFNRTMQVVSVQ